ncbi:MAG TPA: glycosyltransferase family 39 protein [Mycobacteriales bacterium]|nr:glycosyltransferase family 39 protein [Mycobacteriales bacterium]
MTTGAPGAAVESLVGATVDPPREASRARWLPAAVAGVLVVSIALRFLSRPPLWLDEAQTVEIARRSLPHLVAALRHDGAPPLYYLLLHGWMSVAGTSTFAIRALSGIFAVASLPVMWFVARRFRPPGSASPWPAVLLLATCPFAVRYATEARMYALVLLLVLLGLFLFERAWSTGSRWAMAAAAVVTGALLLTQYWAMFLIAVVGLGAVGCLLRGDRRGWRVVVPLAVGCLAFVPWLPTFAYQSAHTGAPWGAPPGLETPLLTLRDWSGGWLSGPLLGVAYYLLIAVALAGHPTFDGSGITFRRPLRRPALLLIGLAVATLYVGVVASVVASSAYASRYSTIVLAPALLVVAFGLAVLPGRARTVALCVVCALGLAGSAWLPAKLRTQAGQVAALLQAAGPHDLVVFCPDQLGPAVHRLAPDAGTQVVYPTFGSAAMVDWVDYEKRNKSADPIAFARQALQRASGRPIWLVYRTGYPTLAGACTSLVTSFTVARGRPEDELAPHGAFEKYTVARFPAAAPPAG